MNEFDISIVNQKLEQVVFSDSSILCRFKDFIPLPIKV